jgi:hypothetical protein
MQPRPPNPEAEQPSCGGPADICEQNVEEKKQSSQDSVICKKKISKNLLILRGPLIGVGVHAHCPMCDREHWHEWFKENGDEEVVEAQCENSYVKLYRLAPFKLSQMEHMEVIARDMGFNLPLRQIHKTSLALAKELCYEQD